MMVATQSTRALVEVPRAHAGRTFHVTVAPGVRLPVEVPEGAAAGDVLEIGLPPGLGTDDKFLKRLSVAEERDLHAAKRSSEQRLLECSAVHGWRFGRTFKPQGFDPYLTEQQHQQRTVQQAHEQAWEREQERVQRQQIEAEVMAPLQQWRDGLNAAPALSAVRPSPAQRELIDGLCAQQQRQRQRQQQQQRTAHAPSAQADAVRASNAARGRIGSGRAQHEAELIARQRQAQRDPRGAAFR